MTIATRRLPWLLLAGVLLGACGLKGDLVLPEQQEAKPAAAAEAAAPATNAPAADEPDGDQP